MIDFKIFFIGFNKCGTRSFTTLLRSVGLKAYHGGDHGGILASQIATNLKLGRKILDGSDNYDGYSDNQSLSYHFRELDRDYPNSKFVLNTRDVDGWIVSRLNHYTNPDGSIDYSREKKLAWHEWANVWREQFLVHEDRVIEYFRGRETDFLRYDIEKDMLPKFNKFIGVEFRSSRSDLPHHGKTAEQLFSLEGGRIIKNREAP